MKVVIDQELCTGHGRCYMLAPDVFYDDDAGYGQVKGDGEVAPEHEDQARTAMQNCPEDAISLVE